MKLVSQPTRKRARLEIIPLIDIIFFLLAIFIMLSLAMIKNQGIRLNLPKSSSALEQSGTNEYVISLTQTGQIYFNKTAVSLVDLKSQLQSLPRDTQIFIQGEAESELQEIVRLLDAVRIAGLNKVVINTEKQRG